MSAFLDIHKCTSVHDQVKKAIVESDKLQARLVMRSLRNTERVLNNKGMDEIIRIEKEKGADPQMNSMRHLVAGAKGKWVLHDGKVDGTALSYGMLASLIHDAA